MKGFILAAGLGSRLKPWTDHHPKALVEVRGVPMLERVIRKMHANGIFDITVNTFHFAEQITDFIKGKGWKINISDERPTLLETGGGLLKAAHFLKGDEPILVHNVDILSNADFGDLEKFHLNNNSDITLLVSDRSSSRKLVFSPQKQLRGWQSTVDGSYRPDVFTPKSDDICLAFSGIYVVSPALISEMAREGWNGKFSIIDYLLSTVDNKRYFGFEQPDLELLDIGKPDSLNRANQFIK